LIEIGLILFFISAFLFIYSLFWLKPFSPRRRKLLRMAYLLSFIALVLVLYGRGFLTPLLLVSFFSLLISYVAWEVSLYFMKK